jgi:hypothetical protein
LDRRHQDMYHLACFDLLTGIFSLGDLILLLIGALFGGYLGYVTSQYLYWQSLRHGLFSQVSLLSAFLNCKSKEVEGDPYPIYRMFECKSIELLYHRQHDAYDVCHAIADQMEDLLCRIADKKTGEIFDVSSYKTYWLERLGNLEPNWLAFGLFRKSSSEVLRTYHSKEDEYIRKRRSRFAEKGITTISAESLMKN